MSNPKRVTVFQSTPGGVVPPVPATRPPSRTVRGSPNTHIRKPRPTRTPPPAPQDVTINGGGTDHYAAAAVAPASTADPYASFPGAAPSVDPATVPATAVAAGPSSGGGLSTTTKIWLGVGGAVLLVGYLYYRHITAPIRRVGRVISAAKNLSRAVKGT